MATEKQKKVFGVGAKKTSLMDKVKAKVRKSKTTASMNASKKKQVNTQKTSVVRNTVGKMSPDDKVAPKMLGRANPQDKKKNMVAKPGRAAGSEDYKPTKTNMGPNMSRGTKTSGQKTYSSNKAPSYMKSSESQSASAKRKEEGEATMKKKRKGPSGPSMTGFK